MSTPDALLLVLLHAAGFEMASHRDGASWVATHADSGQQVEAPTPIDTARAALALLRQQRADLEAELGRVRAGASQIAAELRRLTDERG
jgi:antitoxin component HigA of HigAB toxin-antitoxin module